MQTPLQPKQIWRAIRSPEILNTVYIPKQFDEQDPKHLAEVMQRYNFATLFSQRDNGPFATHLPVLARQEQDHWVIDAHVAKANPQWQALIDAPHALIVFQGPHMYVSPSQYRSDRRVPTWNYIAVHASGPMEVTHDREEKLAILARLIEHHDPEFASHWSDFEEKLRSPLLDAIVGLKMRVTTLEGKFKLNQHRLADDRPELQEEYSEGDENRREIAYWMGKLGLWPARAE
jgi:transcriptional regulator